MAKEITTASGLKYSITKHFADDTSLLLKNNSLKQLKKHLNLDLRFLCLQSCLDGYCQI